MTHVPFNRPFFAGKEFEFIQQAIAGSHISGDGLFTRKCHALLEQELAFVKTKAGSKGEKGGGNPPKPDSKS